MDEVLPRVRRSGSHGIADWAVLLIGLGVLGQDGRMTVLLLGNSNFARLYHELPDLVPQACGPDVHQQTPTKINTNA